MNNNLNVDMEEKEIGMEHIIRSVLKRAWLVGIVSVLSAVLFFVVTFFCITPKYESTAKFYVNNNSISVGSASVSLSSGDLTAARNLVDSYIVILQTRETLNDVLDYAGVNLKTTELEKMITAGAVDNTEIFEVTVTSESPKEAEAIANAIAYILPNRITSIIEGTSAKVVEAAVVPSKPSSPSYAKNTVLGFLVGMILTVGGIVLWVVFDTTIRAEDDIVQSCNYPILATVPDMNSKSKDSAYYGKDRTRSKKGRYASAASGELSVLGPNISFAASEAYKLLRTKLQFSFTDDNNSRVIGVSSALSGEGKSLTSVNLAYTLSQLGQKVLLVDCDMRRPTLAEKLGIRKKPGLSSYLTRQCHLNDLLQPCGINGNPKAFYVISAGENPPNPIELLSSETMKLSLQAMRETFDYVILDLPPVGEVSDALAVAKETDGMLLVTRQNVCDRYAFVNAVHEFEFIDAKILGIVLNGANESSGKYGKGYKKSYYKKYSNAYAASDRDASKSGRREII